MSALAGAAGLREVLAHSSNIGAAAVGVACRRRAAAFVFRSG